MRVQHALPTPMGGRPAAKGAGSATTTGTAGGARGTPRRPTWPWPRDRRRTRGIVIRITWRRPRRRSWEAIILGLGDVDRHREPDEGTREARDAVRVGIQGNAIAWRQEEL